MMVAPELWTELRDKLFASHLKPYCTVRGGSAAFVFGSRRAPPNEQQYCNISDVSRLILYYVTYTLRLICTQILTVFYLIQI